MAVPRAAAPARPAAKPQLTRIAEAAACAALGAVLAAAAWSLVDLTVAAGIVGGLNGAVSGTRRIYRWRSVSGAAAFVLDSTWALLTTAGSLAVHAVALAQRTPGNYVTSLSERRDRHVYARGLTPRRGFLTTIGNVVSGAARTRRREVIDVHEQLHVWQARWFGPLYPVIYGTWTVLGAGVGVGRWAWGGRRQPLWKAVEATAYYANPFERWAYHRQRSAAAHPSVSC